MCRRNGNEDYYDMAVIYVTSRHGDAPKCAIVVVGGVGTDRHRLKRRAGESFAVENSPLSLLTVRRASSSYYRVRVLADGRPGYGLRPGVHCGRLRVGRAS